MTPAVDEMTVKEERACLSEIRNISSDITYKHLLFNGWTAGHFTLKYVTGHYRKRKIKEKCIDGIEIEGSAEDSTPIIRDTDESNMGFMYLCDPFSTRPSSIKDALIKQTKRTQRYRSTAKSRILGMTVGDIRYCFQQLRNAGACLTPDFVLYNGQCAGEFALCYLIETSNSMRNRRKRQSLSVRVDSEQDNKNQDPQTQLSQPCRQRPTGNGMVLFS